MPDAQVSPAWVKDRLQEIREKAKSYDDEAAHIAEDDLRAAVLAAIADLSADDPVECARLALTSSEIKFSRYYS